MVEERERKLRTAGTRAVRPLRHTETKISVKIAVAAVSRNRIFAIIVTGKPRCTNPEGEARADLLCVLERDRAAFNLVSIEKKGRARL